MKRTLAAAHFLLISPAVLFLVAVLVQHLPLKQPAVSAHYVVMWYAERMWTLWILLLALPLSALTSGCVSLMRDSHGSVAGVPQKALAGLPSAGARTSVAITTFTAAVIVGIVVLHMLAN